MTTTAALGSAPDLNFQRCPTAEEADAYRALIAELDRQLRAATEAAANLSALADAWHTTATYELFMPDVAEDGEGVLDPTACGQPAGRGASTGLQVALRAVVHQAYAVAGHYQRVARRLGADLAAELRTPYVAYRLLALDELGQLSYVKPSDEWVDGAGEPLGNPGSPLQAAGHRLQQAGLLPDFDRHFSAAAEPEANADGGERP